MTISEKWIEHNRSLNERAKASQQDVWALLWCRRCGRHKTSANRKGQEDRNDWHWKEEGHDRGV